MVSAPFGNIDLTPAYKFLKILDLPKIFMLETGKYHFKLAKNLLPTQFGNYFNTSATQAVSHTYNLRNSNRPPKIYIKS